MKTFMINYIYIYPCKCENTFKDIANDVYCSILTHIVCLKLSKNPPENPPDPTIILSKTTKETNFHGHDIGLTNLYANASIDD